MFKQILFSVICAGWIYQTACATDPHLQKNPVYRQLLEEGVAADGENYQLPTPGLEETGDAEAQTAVIEKYVSKNLRERFFRKSVVAPHVVKLETLERNDGSRFRVAHFWFAAQARLDEIDEDDFVESVRAEEREEDSGEGEILDEEALAKRGIEVETNQGQQENYGHGSTRLLKKVDITATSRSFWSQDETSAVAAMMLDPRFVDDEEFPNTWRKLTRNDAGKLIAGDPQPYAGSGGYVRISQLVEPEGFVLVEGHIAFVEPEEWFRGANLLGSKLPALIQTEVRAVRKALLKAAASK